MFSIWECSLPLRRNLLRLIALVAFIGLSANSFAYEKESDLSVLIVGKVAKFITWENYPSETFVITVLKNPFYDQFDKTYAGRRIKDKRVEIKYIDDISELGFTNILFVPEVSAEELLRIKKKVSNKYILTVSDARGFAERGGMVQIYFAAQKVRLKINHSLSVKENLKISAALLSIADIVEVDE